ncbi:LytR C-terminal domain-containing protein [Candidatus Gottesmanbacteria bacterium]|nr:LytR C-terminal domain-containing protein [Candidatus Gottesmanbacteria bacterium]
MIRDGREQRIGSRYLPRIIFAVASVFFVLLAIISWNIVTALPDARTSFVIVSDPVRVLSWDETRGHLTIIPLPADVRIDGVFGVGSLPLASLRTLESLDTKKKGVFAASLEEVLALPIAGVVNNGTQDATRVLSPFVLSSWWDSGLSLPLRFRLWWIFVGLRPDAVTTVDLGSQGVFRADLLADGSRVRVFDINRYDAVIGSRLEVDPVRREELRVRVVNTTDVVGLGSRAARMLNHAGMVVVAVENASPVQRECTLHVNKDLWESHSVQFIRSTFSCVVTAGDLDERADVMVRLGLQYAKKY